MDGFITSSISFLLLCTESPQIVPSFEIIIPVVFSGSETWDISMGSSAHSLRIWSEMSARTVATSGTRDPHLLLRGLGSSLDWVPQFSAGQLPGPQMLEATLSPHTICSLFLVANRMLFSSDPSCQVVKEWCIQHYLTKAATRLPCSQVLSRLCFVLST